jgi:hypothetical protein
MHLLKQDFWQSGIRVIEIPSQLELVGGGLRFGPQKTSPVVIGDYFGCKAAVTGT